MFRKHPQSKILLKATLSALLVVALSGAYALFCCAGMKMEAADAVSCPLAKTDHCNFSKKKASETSQTASGLDLFECCNLKFNFFVAHLEKNEFPQQVPSLANNFFNFFRSVKLAPKTGFTAFSAPAPVRARRDLHVRNCVFRI